jgi:hypothetical protein
MKRWREAGGLKLDALALIRITSAIVPSLLVWLVFDLLWGWSLLASGAVPRFTVNGRMVFKRENWPFKGERRKEETNQAEVDLQEPLNPYPVPYI